MPVSPLSMTLPGASTGRVTCCAFVCEGLTSDCFPIVPSGKTHHKMLLCAAESLEKPDETASVLV